MGMLEGMQLPEPRGPLSSALVAHLAAGTALSPSTTELVRNLPVPHDPVDALRDEDLQENARTVGEHVRRRLEGLGERHPLVGTVHGRGLYVGVELVRDRTTLEPAPEETAAVCRRMLELGVIVQPTGESSSILKVKPPLCLTRESADFFVDTLDRVLTEGW